MAPFLESPSDFDPRPRCGAPSPPAPSGESSLFGAPKKFLCDYGDCGRTYTTPGNLRTHQKKFDSLISFYNDDPKAVAGGIKALIITQVEEY